MGRVTPSKEYIKVPKSPLIEESVRIRPGADPLHLFSRKVVGRCTGYAQTLYALNENGTSRP